MQRPTQRTVKSRSANHVGAASAAPASVPEILTAHVELRTPRELILASVRRVADAYGVSLEQVMSRDRFPPLTKARAEVMYTLTREFPTLSTCAIARVFGCTYHNVYSILRRYEATKSKQLIRDWHDGDAGDASTCGGEPTTHEVIA